MPTRSLPSNSARSLDSPQCLLAPGEPSANQLLMAVWRHDKKVHVLTVIRMQERRTRDRCNSGASECPAAMARRRFHTHPRSATLLLRDGRGKHIRDQCTDYRDLYQSQRSIQRTFRRSCKNCSPQGEPHIGAGTAASLSIPARSPVDGPLGLTGIAMRSAPSLGAAVPQRGYFLCQRTQCYWCCPHRNQRPRCRSETGDGYERSTHSRCHPH